MYTLTSYRPLGSRRMPRSTHSAFSDEMGFCWDVFAKK
jgi:hypothetical protein